MKSPRLRPAPAGGRGLGFLWSVGVPALFKREPGYVVNSSVHIKFHLQKSTYRISMLGSKSVALILFLLFLLL